MTAALKLTPQDASLDRVESLTQHATKMLRARKLDAVSFALESAQAIVDRLRREQHASPDVALTWLWRANATSMLHAVAFVDGVQAKTRCGKYLRGELQHRANREKCRRCK